MKYCVYLTIYFGSLLPRRYIGSSSVQRILNGYNGSVASKRWKKIFTEEQKNSKRLFKTRILSLHKTREEALERELELQKKYNVVVSSRYFNESYARVNGFFGRDVSGYNNPMYNVSHIGEKHNNGDAIRQGLQKFYSSDRGTQQKNRLSERFSGENNPMFGKQHTEEWKRKKSESMMGEKHPLYGRSRSKEIRLKMSQTRIARKIEPWNKNKKLNDGQKMKFKKPKKKYIVNETTIVENAAEYCKQEGLCYNTFITRANNGTSYKGLTIRKL